MNWIRSRLVRGVPAADILILGHDRIGMETMAGRLGGQPTHGLP